MATSSTQKKRKFEQCDKSTLKIAYSVKHSMLNTTSLNAVIGFALALHNAHRFRHDWEPVQMHQLRTGSKIGLVVQFPSNLVIPPDSFLTVFLSEIEEIIFGLTKQ